MNDYENNNNGMTGKQKCFLAVVGLLTLDTAIGNICRVMAHKNALKSAEKIETNNKKSSDDDED